MTLTAHTRSTRTDDLSLASHITGDILRRAGLVALVVGGALTLVNQSAAIFGDEAFEYLPLALVFLTPFVVVAISQVLGIRQAIVDASRQIAWSTKKVSFLTTAISHGIPARAVLVGLIAGSLNSAIIGTVALVQHGNLDTVTLAPFGQAFSLPILFGMLSQAISYQRAVSAHGHTRIAQPVTEPKFAL